MALSPRTRDRGLAFLLGLVAVAWLLGVEGREGFGRDEGQYMRAGERYWGWFEELGGNIRAGKIGQSFTKAGIDRYWSDNAPDHPVIMKTLYGLSWRAFHRCTCTGPARGLHPIPVHGRHVTLPLFERESTAFRFPAILFCGALIAMVFFFARQFIGPLPAAVAAMLTLAQPHYFFHAPIACFDAPVTTMAFAVGFAYWKSLRSPRWGVLSGLVFGIALGVKHNAWLMPIFLVGHYVWMRRGDLRALRLPRIPLAFVSMLLLGPVIFFLHWPWLWHTPVARAKQYVNRHLQHEHYNFEYLGRNWNEPPTETRDKLLRATAPVVETGLTVPVTTLALALLGAAVLIHRRRRAPLIPDGPPEDPLTTRPNWLRPGADVDRAPGAFMAVQIFGPLAVLSLPSTPIFGGVKHFLTANPYIAVAAGFGLAWMLRAIAGALSPAHARLRQALPIALALLVTAPAVVETRRSFPDGLSHYNMIAGGFAGGASLGMNRQFWGYAALPLLDWINANPHRTNMYWHDVISDALHMYKREGRLAMNAGDTGQQQAGIQHSDLGLLFYEKHWAMYEGWFWDDYGTVKPVKVSTREGVPIVTVYQRGIK
ncbi:MAG TPA: glycosyltransferase family 39 protein [Polyangia bacterium]|jgi:hypothetical protein|nr:glycosyltransferase family 39 protein [Polyangia bacterium]